MPRTGPGAHSQWGSAGTSSHPRQAQTDWPVIINNNKALSPLEFSPLCKAEWDKNLQKRKPSQRQQGLTSGLWDFHHKGTFSSPFSEGQRDPPGPLGMSLEPHKLLWLPGLAQTIFPNPCQVIPEHEELPMPG